MSKCSFYVKMNKNTDTFSHEDKSEWDMKLHHKFKIRLINIKTSCNV